MDYNSPNKQLIYYYTDGKSLNSYIEFGNILEWSESSNLLDTHTEWTNGEALNNFGDLPSHFVLSFSGTLAKGTNLKIGETLITVEEEVVDLEWNSLSGLVIGYTDRYPKTRKPV